MKSRDRATERATRVHELLANLERNRRYCPQAPTNKQAAFIALDCDEALYGGAAGGGKSSALLMAALQYAHVPGYNALILRRSYADLSLPNAIMDRAAQWLRPTDARWDASTKTWRFPSGARLTFGYLSTASDHMRYQGAELQFCAFDELTQFQSYQYRYLFSRLRKIKGIDVPTRMRGATNPGGPGHDWVKRRFIVRRRKYNRVFIPARLDENPHLDREEYERNLLKLDPVTRARLLAGDWFVGATGLVYPDFNTTSVEPSDVPWDRLKAGQAYGGIDWGFTNPFAAVQGWLDHDDVLWVTFCRYKRFQTVAQHAARLPQDVDGVWFADPSRPENIRELVQADFAVHAARNSIDAGIDIVSERIRTGRLKVVSTLTPLFAEAGLYIRGGEASEDDDEEDGDELDPSSPIGLHAPDPDAYDEVGESAQERPVDQHNHAMDALRYLCVGVAGMNGSSWANAMSEYETKDPEEEAREAAEREKKFRRIDNKFWWQGESGGDDD